VRFAAVNRNPDKQPILKVREHSKLSSLLSREIAQAGSTAPIGCLQCSDRRNAGRPLTCCRNHAVGRNSPGNPVRGVHTLSML
jgi:hypothetical protein